MLSVALATVAAVAAAAAAAADDLKDGDDFVLAIDIASLGTLFACAKVALYDFGCAIGLDRCHTHRMHSSEGQAVARTYSYCSYTFAVCPAATFHTVNRRNYDLPTTVAPVVASDIDPFGGVTSVVASLTLTSPHQSLRRQTTVHGMSAEI